MKNITVVIFTVNKKEFKENNIFSFYSITVKLQIRCIIKTTPLMYIYLIKSQPLRFDYHTKPYCNFGPYLYGISTHCIIQQNENC